jgi:cell wall-associated NlpC family hydrolase
MSWAARYVGLPYVAGEAECWHFAARVWREVFGWDVPVAASFGGALASRRLASDPASYDGWQPVADPEDGDAVVMAKGARPCHVGVWVAPGHVLHAVEGAGGLCTPAGRVGDLGYRITGFYRRVTP